MTSTIYNKGVEEDLHILSSANHYRLWLWDEIRAWVGQRIFEIGSGIGNYVEFLSERKYIILSDYDTRYVDMLRSRCSSKYNVEVINFDCNDINSKNIAYVREKCTDTVLCMNVLEHIRDDETCISAMADCLTLNGRIVLVVPAMQSLYGEIDVQYGHFRRYDKNDISRLAYAAGMIVEHCRHFNLMGVFGWIINGKCKRRSRLSFRQVELFDRMVPIIRWMDYMVWHRFGLSLVIVLKKVT